MEISSAEFINPFFDSVCIQSLSKVLINSLFIIFSRSISAKSSSAELVVVVLLPQRRTRKKKQLLTVIRDFASEKTQEERRVSDLKNRVGELQSEIEVATANIEEAMKRKNSPAAAIKCLHDSDSFVDVNFVGDVRLKVCKAEVVLREESPNEVRVGYEEFKTDVTALFLAVHNGNVTIVRKLLSIGAYVNQKLFRGYSTTIDGDKPVNNLSSANLDCANDEVKFESRGGVPLFHESNKVQAKLEDEILNVKLQRKVNSSLVCGTSMCVDVEALDSEGISLESAVETESQSKSSGSWTLSLFFWTLAAVMTVIPNCGTNDVYVAYLPLAHVFELVAETVMMAGDASIGYSLALTLTDTSDKIKKGTQGDASVLKHSLMTGGFYFSNLQKVFKVIGNYVALNSNYGSTEEIACDSDSVP